jgi:NADH-quinone oxidoreductase subunit I
MDHEYELSEYKRSFLWGMDRLVKPLSYHAELHPTAFATEQAEQEKKAAKKKQ